MTGILIKGIIIGFSVAAPVGPVGLLILRRTINEGRTSGFVSGAGAATADLVCGLAATFGLAALLTLIDHHHAAFQLFGGIFMIVLGIHAFRAKPPQAANRPLHERNLYLAYIFTFLLTMANPLTLVGMVGVVAAAGVGGPSYGYPEKGVLNAGIFAGSSLWWLILVSSARWLGQKLGNKTLHALNVVAGAIITAFGTWQLLSLLMRWVKTT